MCTSYANTNHALPLLLNPHPRITLKKVCSSVETLTLLKYTLIYVKLTGVLLSREDERHISKHNRWEKQESISTSCILFRQSLPTLSPSMTFISICMNSISWTCWWIFAFKKEELRNGKQTRTTKLQIFLHFSIIWCRIREDETQSRKRSEIQLQLSDLVNNILLFYHYTFNPCAVAWWPKECDGMKKCHLTKLTMRSRLEIWFSVRSSSWSWYRFFLRSSSAFLQEPIKRQSVKQERECCLLLLFQGDLNKIKQL